MYDIILGTCASSIIGFIYALLFWYTQRIDFLTKNILIKILILIGRIGLLVLFSNLILKSMQVPLILFIIVFFITYSLTIFSLQRNV